MARPQWLALYKEASRIGKMARGVSPAQAEAVGATVISRPCAVAEQLRRDPVAGPVYDDLRQCLKERSTPIRLRPVDQKARTAPMWTNADFCGLVYIHLIHPQRLVTVQMLTRLSQNDTPMLEIPIAITPKVIQRTIELLWRVGYIESTTKYWKVKYERPKDH